MPLLPLSARFWRSAHAHPPALDSVAFRQGSELWEGILRAGVRFPPLILSQPPAVRARLRTAFDRYVGRYARSDGSLDVPTSIQVAAARRP